MTGVPNLRSAKTQEFAGSEPTLCIAFGPLLSCVFGSGWMPRRLAAGGFGCCLRTCDKLGSVRLRASPGAAEGALQEFRATSNTAHESSVRTRSGLRIGNSTRSVCRRTDFHRTDENSSGDKIRSSAMRAAINRQALVSLPALVCLSQTPGLTVPVEYSIYETKCVG